MTEEHARQIDVAQRMVILSIRNTLRELVELHRLTQDIPDANNLAFHLGDYARQLVDRMESGKFVA